MYTTYNTEVITYFFCLLLAILEHFLSDVDRNTELLTLLFGDMHSPGVAKQHDSTTQRE